MNEFILIKSIDHIVQSSRQSISQLYKKLKRGIAAIEAKNLLDINSNTLDLTLKPISCIMPGTTKDTYLCGSLIVYDVSQPDDRGLRQMTNSNLISTRMPSIIDSILNVGDYTVIFTVSGLMSVFQDGNKLIQKNVEYAGGSMAKIDIVRSKNRAELIDGVVYYLKGKGYELEAMVIDFKLYAKGIKTETIIEDIQSFSYHAMSKVFYCMHSKGKHILKITRLGKVLKCTEVETEFNEASCVALKNRLVVVSDGREVRGGEIFLLTLNLRLIARKQATATPNYGYRMIHVDLCAKATILFILDLKMTHSSYLITTNRILPLSQRQYDIPPDLLKVTYSTWINLCLIGHYCKASKSVIIISGGMQNIDDKKLISMICELKINI